MLGMLGGINWVIQLQVTRTWDATSSRLRRCMLSNILAYKEYQMGTIFQVVFGEKKIAFIIAYKIISGIRYKCFWKGI